VPTTYGFQDVVVKGFVDEVVILCGDAVVARHFDREVIILYVRGYLRFKLSLRDLAEMMAERGLSMAHTTIMRWVQRFAPEFEKRWRRFAQAVGQSWRVGCSDILTSAAIAASSSASL
jgi:transposase-like protein